MQFDSHSGRWRRSAPMLQQTLDRRRFLRDSFLGLGLVAIGGSLSGCSGGGGPLASTAPALSGTLGNLSPTPDANGLLLPPGFTARVIGQAGQVVPGTNFRWHTDPDAGAVFARPGGGWVYTSNREFLPGGVDAIEFDASGQISRAYNILPGAQSRLNCGGGVTPWNTWLSGEEYDLGVIWECDPFGVDAPRRLPALGTFSHEAATVDATSNIVYLTEDQPDGRFYRFVPTTPNIGGRADLTAGRLQALRILADPATVNAEGRGGRWAVEWLDIANPNSVLGGVLFGTPTRLQAPDSFAFDGGEGVWYQRGIVYFATKGDRRVWALDVAAQRIEAIYDDAGFSAPVLSSVDNIVLTPRGDIVVSEDQAADAQVVAIRPDGRIQPLVQLGPAHAGSEVTGPAFSPDGRFFYFSSQRGTSGRTGVDGITYAVEGPWLAS